MAAAAVSPTALPDLDFEQPLGAFHGVVAYSNVDDHFFSGEKNYDHGVYTGYKYQCVEYARRFLLNAKGCVFGNCGRAAEIFSMKTVTEVSTGVVHPLIGMPNGQSKEKPMPGDILVYPWDPVLMPVGHVAIISAVGDDWVGIAEQNQESKTWEGRPYGRKEPLRRDPETQSWTIVETDTEITPCSGWMRCDVAWRLDDQGKPLGPLKVLPQFADEKKPMTATRFRLSRAIPSFASEHQAVNDCVSGYRDAAGKRGRDPHYDALYLPNEELGVGSIGAIFRVFKIATSMILRYWSQSPDAQSCTKLWDVPTELVPLVTQQLRSMETKRASGHAFLGRFKLSVDARTNHHNCVDVNLDCLDHFIDVLELMEIHGRSNGFNKGFYPGRIKGDSLRVIRDSVLLACAGNRNASAFDSQGNKAQLLFVDLGASVTLPKSLFATEADVAAYDVQRWNALYVANYFKLLSQKEELTSPSDSAHKFGFDVTIATVDQLIYSEAATSPWDVRAPGMSDSAVFVMKLAPWRVLFAAQRAGVTGVNMFFEKCVRADDESLHGANARPSPLVVQPLWTALTAHPEAMKRIALATLPHDAAELRHHQDVDLVSTPLAPAPDDSSMYQFYFPVQPALLEPKTCVDGPEFLQLLQATKRATPQEVVDRCTATIPTSNYRLALCAIVAGCRWSAGCFLETTRASDEAAGSDGRALAALCDQPAPMFYMFPSADEDD